MKLKPGLWDKITDIHCLYLSLGSLSYQAISDAFIPAGWWLLIPTTVSHVGNNVRQSGALIH